MKKQYFKNFRKEGLPGGPNELIINSEGFILSENGQWEFPGLPTVIPSSDITMENVPYPVLGISDTGDTQMMYPEEDYQFDGDMVYELPMAQKGYNVKPRKGSILLEGETEPSTHLMRREYIPNTGWVAFPSLFQNEDGTWVDMSKEEDWMNIYDEANRRGEVYNFGENKRKAIKFADKGSWKKDLGIKKQGGGDISIPDLTKPNWLNNLPKAQNGKITEAIYKYAKQFKPGSVDDSQQMDNLGDPITDEFPNVDKTWLRDVMWGTPLKEPVLTGFEEEGRTFKNYKELKLYNETHDSETGLPIDIDKVNRKDSKGMFPMSYPNYKPKFIEKQNDVSVDTPGDVEDSNEDKLQYAKGGWLNNLPKAQKGNTGKQSANESWGLTQESQLSDLTKGLLNNILHRQAFAESSFNPKVISGDKTSRVGALGMTQIMPETLNEYINKTGDKNINILDPKDAVKVQKWYMQDLLNADFIHKPNQSEKVRMVKALGSYNWGRGNMSKFLGKQKKKGVDIYSDELSWVNDLPVETRDYVNKIVLGTNEKFNQEYKQNSSKYKDYYQKGGWLDELQDGGNTLYHSRKPIEGKQDPYQLMQFIKSYIGPNDLDIQERPYKKPIPSYKDLYKDIYYDLYPDQIKGDKKVQNGGSAKLLNRSRKEIIKQRELEENLRKEGFNEDGVFTRVLPEYTVKSPEKKLYDEAFQDVLNKQKSFQNKWYPGDISEGVLDNMKQRASVIANDKVAKDILDNNKIKDLKGYQKEYIANSNYSGKLRPGIFQEFGEGVQDLGRITQGKLPTSKSLGILSPLEYPVNLVRGTIKGEGVDALKGKISSPWIDASKVDIGAVNDVGAYNTIYNIGFDPLNLTGIGLTGAADDVLKGISKGSKYFKTNKIVNTPKQLPNPSLGEPLGTVEDVANRSAIQYAGSEPYLFNPQTNTWEILRNEINDKYRQGYTDIPGFNEQLKQIKTTTEFGKKPLVKKEDFYTLKEIEDKANQQSNYYKLLEDYEKANPRNPSDMIWGAFTKDNSYMDTFHNLYPKAELPDWSNKFFNPEDYKILEESLPYQYTIKNPLSKTRLNILNNGMDKILPSAKPLAKGDNWFYTAKPKDYVMEMRGSLNLSIDDVKKMNDSELKLAAEKIFNKLKNQQRERYLNDINQQYKGVDAFQKIEPNQKGGQKKGWLDKL